MGILKRIVALYVDLAAHIAGYSFPQKYNWRWKLKVLLRRYELETTRLIVRELKPGFVFVDIGAHIGYFTRLAAQRVGPKGNVIAFEADHENFPILARNTARFSNVTLVKEAIGEREGLATFYHVRGSTGCHSLIQSDASDSYEVPVTTLDAYLARNGIVPTMIKMDIEGGEWNALHGMEKTLQIPGLALIIEYNLEALQRAGINPHDLLRRLFASGYAIQLLLTKGAVRLSPSELGIIDENLEAGSVNIYCTKAVLP